MTDQNPTVTDEDRRIARDWASHVLNGPLTYAPDQTLAVARVLNALLPEPLLPTLADMTPEERAECRKMQADVEGYQNRAVIIQPYLKDGYARVMWETPRMAAVSWENITPRPDLPKLEWPGDTPTPAAPTLPPGWQLADHPEHGRVILTDDTPGLDGWIYGVFASDMDGTGFDWHPYDPGELTLLDQDTPAAPPPNTITLGSTWTDTDTLAHACNQSGRDQITVTDKDGYAFIWAHDAEWWEGSAQPIHPPYTIIHTGREADQ